MTFVKFYCNPITEFDRLLEHTLTARLCPRAPAPSTEARHTTSRHLDTYRPRLDLHEDKDANTVTAIFELPGLTSESVTIDIHQNRLTVSGELPLPDSEEKRSYLVRERCSGKFSRTLQLAFGTKPDDVTAKMENGILTITFPKTSPDQEAKRIAIQ